MVEKIIIRGSRPCMNVRQMLTSMWICIRVRVVNHYTTIQPIHDYQPTTTTNQPKTSPTNLTNTPSKHNQIYQNHRNHQKPSNLRNKK